jgi:hypothetical protein
MVVIESVSSGCLLISTIDINSTDIDGVTPMMLTLYYNKLDAGMLLIEKGANIFKKTNVGERTIDIKVHDADEPTDVVIGPQVMQHALDLRWTSVRDLLLIANFHETSEIISFSSPRRSPRLAAPLQSAHLAASMFTIQGIVRHVAEYLIRTEIIVRDPTLKKREKEPDDVKRRIEAALAAAAEGSNKRARNELK